MLQSSSLGIEKQGNSRCKGSLAWFCAFQFLTIKVGKHSGRAESAIASPCIYQLLGVDSDDDDDDDDGDNDVFDEDGDESDEDGKQSKQLSTTSIAL